MNEERDTIMNLGEALLNGLKTYGAKHIFGLPGDFILPFFNVMENSNILPFYTFSHEPTIGFAADAAARHDGTLGVAVVTYGAGALNMVNTVACAYAEKSPLVVISGAPGAGESKEGLLLHHQCKTLDSQFEIFKEVTCAQISLTDAQTAPQEIAKVLRECMDQSRPVYIELPRDMVFEDCQDVPYLEPFSSHPEALDICADEVLKRLNRAEQPIMMVGVEIRRYGLEDKVTELAKRLNIPVVTSFMGRGLLAGSDAPVLGTYIGVAGEEDVSDYVETSDCLLMLGVILSDTNFGVSGKKIDLRRMMNASDGQMQLGYHYYPKIAVAELVDALLEKAVRLEQQLPNITSVVQPDNDDGDTPLKPDHVVTALNALFAEKGVMPMAADVGDCLFTAMDVENTELVASGYYATMGFGVPAGLGLQIASQKRPIILVGDGAFQMTGWELGHCKRYNLTPIVLVLNNKGWEMLRTFQPQADYHDLGEWPFAKMADLLSGKGARVQTKAELVSALDVAVEDDQSFHLIEVMLPQGCISTTLKRFAKAIAKT